MMVVGTISNKANWYLRRIPINYSSFSSFVDFFVAMALCTDPLIDFLAGSAV